MGGHKTFSCSGNPRPAPILPLDTIQLWSGAVVDIPYPWVLCDGSKGTPDLRNKFVVGAGDTYAKGQTGGSINHNHPFTGDGHRHAIPAGGFIGIGTNFFFQTSIDPTTGATDNTNNLPFYYALCYIQLKGAV